VGGFFMRGAISRRCGVVDLCSAHSDGLVGFPSFKNEHGRCFSDARDTFELGENEVAKSLHVANPQAKDVIEVACYQQTLRNFRLTMDRRQKFSDVFGVCLARRTVTITLTPSPSADGLIRAP
jgi:hypothetical protein